MELKLTNSLSRKKELFASLKHKQISLYVCGITPYDLAHIGHGRCYVSFDLLVRILKGMDYNITYVRNYTDIDDKILRKAADEGYSDYTALAEKFITLYQEDMQALNNVQPNVEPRVTQCIDEIIEFIQGLIAQNKAYIVDHDVYFDITSFSGYGKLSGKNIDELEAGARVEIDTRKKNSGDFALWKGCEEGSFWQSPWGNGRPGWAIECSVMAKKHLGETIDIHAGGADLIFPHHENEIAQSEGLHKKPFAHYWLHNAFVNINKEKMSKSLGNFITLKKIFEHYDPMILRYFFLQHHYRTPIDFSFDELEGVQTAYKKLIAHLGSPSTLATQPITFEALSKIDPLIAMMLEALCDDLNSPKLLGIVFQNLDHIKRSPVLTSATQIILQNILGLTLQTLPEKKIELTPEIAALIQEREQARTAKDWQRSDALRDKLAQMGYQVHDQKQAK